MADDKSWVERKHPKYEALAALERRRWATYHATVAALAPFLVRHRFEGPAPGPEKSGAPISGTLGVPAPLSYRPELGHKVDPFALRSQLGHAMRNNRNLITDLLGHIARQGCKRQWGRLNTGPDEAALDGPAAMLMGDATRGGMGWLQFWGADVLRQMLVGVGAVVVVDAPARAAERPYVSLTTMPAIWDWRLGPNGLTAIKLAEAAPEPDIEEAMSDTERVLLYRLDVKGETIVRRYDVSGEPLEEPLSLGVFLDTDQRPTLPIVPVAYGRNSLGAKPWGDGYLGGLDDIVIDTFNRTSELRAEERNVVFDFLAYWGGSEGFEAVQRYAEAGASLWHAGTERKESSLERISAGVGGVSHYVEAIKDARAQWTESADRKPAELLEGQPRSGASFAAEFAVTRAAVLADIAQRLDELETWAMFLVGQMAGLSPEQADELGAQRDTAFRLEDEASAALNLAAAVSEKLPVVPPTLARALTMRAAAALHVLEPNELEALPAEIDAGLALKRAEQELFASAMPNAEGGGG